MIHYRFTCNTQNLHGPRNVESNKADPFRFARVHQIARYHKTLLFFRLLSNHCQIQDNGVLKNILYH